MPSKDYPSVFTRYSEETGREQLRPSDRDEVFRLNEAAQQQLAAGNADAAITLLSRAVETDDSIAELWFNLANALRRASRLSDALSAMARCVALSPRNLLAALEKGSIEEALGQKRAAAFTYRTALQMLPASALAPLGLETAVEHARVVIAAANRELEAHVSERLADLRTRYDNISLARFDQCVDIMLRKRAIYHQQPTFMYFPQLPTIEFYPRELFPELHSLEAASIDIRHELLAVMSEGPEALEPYLTGPQGASSMTFGDLVNSRRWGAYYFWKNAQPFDAHIKRCPRTVEALQRWQLWDVPGNGPTAMFSILEPHTRIPPHTGSVNTRLVVHLPLVIPPHCRFRVGGQQREWAPGEGFVFDDSINHEAWNDSDEARAVLIFTIWSPFLNDSERALVRELTDAVGDFYGVGEFYERRAMSRAAGGS